MLPKTKRYMFSAILDWYRLSITQKCFRSDFVFVYHGVRRIGKTVLLKQLNEEIPYSKYYDCEKYNKQEDCITDIIVNDFNKGIKVFLIDEVCKYHDLEDLKSFIKCNGEECTFILTGSISEFVKNIGYSIGRGPVMYLQPITYYEWLYWENKSDYSNVFKQSSYNKFLEFIKTGTSNIISNPADYIKSVVDTRESYKIRANTGQIQLNCDDFDDEKFNIILNYMALTSLVRKEYNGKYTNPQKFLHKDKEVTKRVNSIISNYQKLISGYKNDEIRKYLMILTSSGLVNNHRSPVNDLNNEEYLVFRYPQYIYKVIGSGVLDSNIFISVIIENLLLDAVSNYYDYASKYMDATQREIDICYNLPLGSYGIEIKCRPVDKINVDLYKSIAYDIGLCDISFTACDITEPLVVKAGKYVIRPDILMLIYEVAYTQNKYNKLSLNDLLIEFKFVD